MWINKKTVWDSERISQILASISQQSGQKCFLDSPRKNCQEICLEKNPSSIVSRTLRWNFLDFRQKLHQGCQNCVSDVRRKTVRIVPDKRRYSCKFRKMSKVFPRIFAEVSSVCQNCCFLAAQRKTTLKKFVFFFKKLVLFSIISNILSKFSGPSTNFFHQGCQTCLFNVQTNFAWDTRFPFKKILLDTFSEICPNDDWTFDNFFSVGTSKLRSRCPEHISEEKVFEKTFSKFSIFYSTLRETLSDSWWKFCSRVLKAAS